MAKLKVGINGFGRIGRVLFRAGFEKLDIVGINSMDDIDGAAHLLKYDSSHGILNAEVSHQEKHLVVNGKKINYSKTKNPAEIPWKDWGVDLVLECTGALKGKEDYQKHLAAGAKKVFVSAPAEGVDLTVVYGINHQLYDAQKHQFLSNASCTTNCLAPVAQVMNDVFGIEHGVMTTIHSYTNDQRILDSAHKDLRRSRSAAVSMIPTTTGAAKAVSLVLPVLKGKLDGLSIRVPTPNVSLVDFTFRTNKEASVQTVNEALIAASKSEALKGILGCEEKELVSIDFNGNPLSSIIDLKCTMVPNPRLVKVMSWYDNETGFSHRMIDMALYMASKGL
jgi:glyceraldehyde 3-phosphate dehydrogenase